MHSRVTPKRTEVNTLRFFIDKYIKKMGYSQIIIWEWTDKQSRYGHSYHYHKNGEGDVPSRMFDVKLQLMQIVYTKYLNGNRLKSIKLEVV